MKTFLFGCIVLFCASAFADLSKQEAHDFAVGCAQILRADDGPKTLKAFIYDAGKSTGKQIGWSESFWFSENKASRDNDLKDLNVDRVLIRNPDSDNSMQVKLTDDKSAKCLFPPEKIAVVYLSSAQKDIRAVLIMPIMSSRGKTMLCPMTIEPDTPKQTISDMVATEKVSIQKNFSTVPGVQIIKVGDDDNSYGFLPPEHDKEPSRTIDTNPLGCTLRQIILHAVDRGIWIKGFNYLPSGRFKIHCELLPDETETIENKLLNATASAFDLNIKIVDDYLWTGYQVVPPNPLPGCFKITKNAVGQSAMHGIGDYEGYSLRELLSNALHEEPIEILSTNTAGRYDVNLEVWPEYYGEMAALEQLGFTIKQTKLSKRTLIISSSKR